MINRISLEKRGKPGKYVGLLAGAALFGAVSAANAATVVVGNQIANGGFGTDATPSLTNWTTSGANARASGDTINDGAFAGDDHNHFDTGSASYFTSGAFAVLGDNQEGIGGAPNSGTHSISQIFTLPTLIGGQSVLSYSLTLGFTTAFDGVNSPTSDIFSATLTGPGAPGSLFSQTFAGAQLNNNPFSLLLTGLTPGGVYTLAFTLFEASGGSPPPNSAAGIDSVSLAGTATVVPLPPAVWLLGSALVGLGLIRRRTVV